MLDITFSESELGWIELTESKAFCIISNFQGRGMLSLKLLFLIQGGKSNFQNDMKSLLKTQTSNMLSFFSWTLRQMFVNNQEPEKKKVKMGVGLKLIDSRRLTTMAPVFGSLDFNWIPFHFNQRMSEVTKALKEIFLKWYWRYSNQHSEINFFILTPENIFCVVFSNGRDYLKWRLYSVEFTKVVAKAICPPVYEVTTNN